MSGMKAIPFRKLLDWTFEEYKQSRRIFGIPEENFYRKAGADTIRLFGEELDSPVGPAAGPHTQLAQNIVAAYLAGGRFFELKTVQVLDKLEFAKPCIWAKDEGYNTEWSTELTIEGAMDEYVKAWFMLYVLQKEIFNIDERRFVFNMSVGYDLQGIQSPKVSRFIEGLKDAAQTRVFQECRNVLLEEGGRFTNLDREYIEHISPHICTSITLSTMHGCRPKEIEAISRYLLGERKLHTFVKLNPTLLGYQFVKNAFVKMGYGYIELKEEAFSHDLHYDDGVAMLRRLKTFAQENGREFGVKLSNTLPVKITKGELPGEEMYLSGRALYPLTINLAYKLAAEFAGELPISYSGGADFFNIDRIFESGIRPITVATTLLKPGGYFRLKQMAELLDKSGIVTGHSEAKAGYIDLLKLRALAESALHDPNYLKEKDVAGKVGASSNQGVPKIETKLPLTDCFTAPCSSGCPIDQNVPEYIYLVGEGLYEEAYEVIVAKNPLPLITGTICTHNCTTKCTRRNYDEHMRIRELKLLAARSGYEGFMRKITPITPAVSGKAAVIGAGPSGLAFGYFMARAGMEVTIFDKRERAGGTVEYVIPEFRIPKEAIACDLELIKKMGVKFEFGTSPDFSLEELKAKGFTYIYLAIGAEKENPIQLAGEVQGVMGAVAFLERFKRGPGEGDLRLGKNVAVIGGGNSAMDAARAALRIKGVEKTYIIYRRTREYMPAAKEEFQLALGEGVIFKELLTPVSFNKGVLRCQRMRLGAVDASGRKSAVAIDGEFVEIPIDTVLSATGELVDVDVLQKNGIELNTLGYVKANPDTLETNLANVFIGGDALYGPSTVVGAIAHAAKAAKAIILRETYVASEEVAVGAQVANARHLAELNRRKGNLQRFTSLEQEPARCLECNYACNVCSEVCPNRANVLIDVVGSGLANANQVIHLDGMCNECGNCAVFCPYAGAPYRDKLTLFWTKQDFKSSTNPGFYLKEGGVEPVFRVRLDGKVFDVRLDDEGDTDAPLGDPVRKVIWAVFKEHRYLFDVAM